MLEDLLKYHQNLVSSEFIDKLIGRINRQFRVRHWVLGIFTCLGLIAGVIGVVQVSNLDVLSSFRDYFTIEGVSPGLSFGLLIVGFVTFMAWILNDEFEIP